MRAECPALMLAFLSLTLPQAVCVCVYQERTDRGSCVCVCRLHECVFVSLTDSPSSHPLIWTIKSMAVLRHEGYDGWSFTSQHLCCLLLSLLPLTTSTFKNNNKKKMQMFWCVFFLSLSLSAVHPISFFFSCCLVVRRDSEGEAEEAGCGGVNPARGGRAESVEVILLSWVC